MKAPSFAPLDAEAAAFLSEATGVDYSYLDFAPPEWFCVSRRDDRGRLMGVLACQFKEDFDAHFSVAVRDPRCLSPKLMRVIFRTLFSRAVRLTALVEPDNQRAIRQALMMGFVYEGFLRLGVEGRRDALLFGMLSGDCRYLPQAPRARQLRGDYHGQLAQAS